MQLYNLKFIRLRFILPLIFVSSLGMAQITNTMFYMRGVPQRYQINPAFQPECNFFLGLPGLSPFQAKVQNSPFALNDAIYYNSQLDSLITFLHPLGDKDAFLSLLKETNFINSEVSASIASFGFKSNNLYFTFDINERVFAQFSYPDDYIRLPIIGPDSGMVYDFNNFAMDFTALNEISMGVSRKFGDRLTIGIRGKILLGQANLVTKLFDVTFSANETAWPLHTDISLNTSSPYLADYVKVAANAPLDLVFGNIDSMSNIDTPSLNELRKMALNPKNFGLGLDIGADYRVNDWLQVSASIIDLGRMSWNSGVVNLTNKSDYYFDGVNYFLDGDKDFFEAFTDSIENTFDKFNSSGTKYATWLPAKIYAGAAFYVHPKINFGVLSRTDFYKGNVRQQFTASANFYPIRMISTSLSYSIIDRYYKNIGIGLALKASPFNFYIITDTGPSAAMWWNKAKYVNLRIGMNMMFGCIREKGKGKAAMYDMPLVD